MLTNYLKVALRSLRKQRGYAFINIAGLALGLACCLLIARYIAHETSFDAFNANAETLYRVTQTSAASGGEAETNAHSAYALGPALESALPEVQHSARTLSVGASGVAVVASTADPDRVFEERRVLYADSSFLDLFSYPVVAGDSERALREPSTLLLSASTARKYFGDANAVGQTLQFQGSVGGEYRVTGVFADVPATSHLQFDILVPLADVLQDRQYQQDTGWGWYNFFTYVQLQENTDLAGFSDQATAVLLDSELGEEYAESGTTARLNAQPLRDIYLNSTIQSSDVDRGSYRTVYFFALVGLVTLLIALVNYVNLATARALDRAREVGVRKAVGARRGQLVAQFLAESALTNAFALVLAVGLAVLLHPVLNRLLDAEISGALWADPTLWGAVALVFLGGTLLAGLYPAFVLSSFRPVAALKGTGPGVGSGLWLRRGLVVLQFSASIVLMVGVAVVYNQLGHMRDLDTGLDVEQIVMVPSPRIAPRSADGTSIYDSRNEAMEALENELTGLSSVQGVAFSYALPGLDMSYGSEMRRQTADPSTAEDAWMTWVSDTFPDLYGLELIAGVGLDTLPLERGEDEPQGVLVNESAVRALGIASPAEAVGEPIDMGGDTMRIIGVLKDFDWFSAHEERANVLLGRARAGGAFSIKVESAGLSETLATIEALYTRLYPGNPFRYQFMDEAFDAQYRADERFATLFGVFAGLAVLIACLGLFGLAAFTARKRTKEIGVRKVLGASAPSILGLLSKDFVQLVAVAFVVAVPIAYVLMQQWLDGFAYHLDLGPGVFLLAGGLVLLLALLSVSVQALRAASADPVQALRYE